MLFLLDANPDELAAVPIAVTESVVSDLLRARRLGHHLVVIRRSSATWIRDHINLSARDQAMLARTAQEFAQVGDLPRRAKVYIRLSPDNQQNLRMHQNAISISFQQLLNYRLLDQSILLVENIDSDGQLYNFLLKNHIDLHHCNAISFELQHGGGADFVRVFAHRIDDGRIVCGIVDSDRSSPTAPNSNLIQLDQIRNDKGWPLAFPGSPPCREAENVIPLALVASLPSGVKNATNGVLLQIGRTEMQTNDAPTNSYWLFFDVKEGLRIGKYATAGIADKAWINGKLSLAGVDPEARDLAGYGNRVISQLFEENKYQSELRKLTRHPGWRGVFSSFLDEIYWILTAAPRLAT